MKFTTYKELLNDLKTMRRIFYSVNVAGKYSVHVPFDMVEFKERGFWKPCFLLGYREDEDIMMFTNQSMAIFGELDHVCVNRRGNSPHEESFYEIHFKDCEDILHIDGIR